MLKRSLNTFSYFRLNLEEKLIEIWEVRKNDLEIVLNVISHLNLYTTDFSGYNSNFRHSQPLLLSVLYSPSLSEILLREYLSTPVGFLDSPLYT